MAKSSLMKGVDDNDDDDHHYLHISSIGYLYVILTLHLNQNHLGTSGPNLLSLRKDLCQIDSWKILFFTLNHKIY